MSEFDLDVFGYHNLYNLVRRPKLTPKPVPEEVPVLPSTPVDPALVNFTNNTSRLESATFFVRNDKLNKNTKETLIRSTEAEMNSIYHTLNNPKFP